MTVARNGITPDDPRHGKLAGRAAGCGCLPCRLARSRWNTTRDRRIAYGTWQPFVDAEPVREHLRMLSDAGIGLEHVVHLSGVPLATLKGLMRARGKRTRPAQRCRARTAEAILTVQPALNNYADKALIDATGTLRRLRALVAVGWLMQDIGRRMPGHPEAVREFIRQGRRQQTTAATARAARTLYDELSTTPPEETVWTRRTRRLAAELGWAPPGAWDDDTIDDPSAVPNLGGSDDDVVDEVAVHRVLNGEPLTLNTAEREHAIAVGLTRGMSPAAISTALRMSGARVRELAAQLQAA